MLDLQPLTSDDVRVILRTYLDDDAVVDEALPRVLRESGGRPGRVHEIAFELARQRAAARVGEATAWTGNVQRALGTARDELREGITEFRDLVEAHDTAPRDVCPWKGLIGYGAADAVW